MSGFSFPVYLSAGPLRLHPHFVFESLAYLVGFRLYLAFRRQWGDVIDDDRRLWVITAAISGAAIGSKLLHWLSNISLLHNQWQNPVAWLGGKTIVGGLLGGWLMVEWAKRRLRITTATGDLFAIPLAVGIAIGRIGCFLSGLDDHTYGLPTRLPWGVDFGDGVMRHPTMLYEIMWLGALALCVSRMSRRPRPPGALFQSFMIGYLGFRFWIEFLKPGEAWLGLTAIQWACVAGLAVCVRRWLKHQQAGSEGSVAERSLCSRGAVEDIPRSGMSEGVHG